MSLRPDLAGLHRFAFGDGPTLADELLALVLSGQKTATAAALRSFGPDNPLPEVGRRDIVLDGAGRPAAVIETVSVRIGPFSSVDAAFAYDEGEGERTRESWWRDHEAYFARNGGFDPEMALVFERFRLVETLPRP